MEARCLLIRTITDGALALLGSKVISTKIEAVCTIPVPSSVVAKSAVIKHSLPTNPH
jgi:predicted transcriptional regulator